MKKSKGKNMVAVQELVVRTYAMRRQDINLIHGVADLDKYPFFKSIDQVRSCINNFTVFDYAPNY